MLFFPQSVNVSKRNVTWLLFFCCQIFISQANSKFTSISPYSFLLLAPDYFSIITHLLSITPLPHICYSLPIFCLLYMEISIYSIVMFQPKLYTPHSYQTPISLSFLIGIRSESNRSPTSPMSVLGV